jgi:hypothetical protein
VEKVMTVKVSVDRMFNDGDADVRVTAALQNLAQMGDDTAARSLSFRGVPHTRHNRNEVGEGVALDGQQVGDLVDLADILAPSQAT